MLKRTLATGISIILLSGSSFGSDGTALGELAESMAPGTWAELPTSGLKVATDAPSGGGSSGHILPFANEFMWDPRSRKAFFIGGDHNGGHEKFIEYDTVTNAWTVMPHPNWMPSSDNQNHSYSYMAYDPRGRFWFESREYIIESQTWIDHSDAGQHSSSARRGRRAFAYLEGVGNVLYFEGAVYIFDEDGNGPWREVEPRFSLRANDSYLHNVAIENPVTKKVLFGGSDTHDILWLIDSDEKITRLGPTPIPVITTNGGDTNIITVDPGTGYFIFLAPTGELWEFDSENDRWTSLGSNTPLSNSRNWQNSTIGATNTTYNVSIYVQWYDRTTPEPKMFLYKHSPADPVERPKPPGNLSAP